VLIVLTNVQAFWEQAAPTLGLDARFVDEAIARANRVAYGFAAYCFTQSASIAAKFVAEIEAGNLGINQMSPSLPDAPVGGVKDSGYGYEGGREGISAFQHVKLVSQTFL